MEYSLQQLIAIINQTPVGIVETDSAGAVRQLNAKGVQLLMPFFLQHGLAGDNLFALFDQVAPDLREVLDNPMPATGILFQQRRFTLPTQPGRTGEQRHFWFTANRPEAGRYTFYFDDITEVYRQERSLQEAVLEKAVQEGKFEIASGILHDIGNAVVAFGSHVTQIRRLSESQDLPNLKGLLVFLNRNQPALQSAFGERAGAVTTLLEGTITSLTAHEEELKQAIQKQLGIITHIQEILAIQRQYIRERGSSGPRPLVNLRAIIGDCTTMLLPSFEKRDIKVTVQVKTDNARLPGDRTKLMQVILNLLKNSQEALERQPSETARRIDILLERDVRHLSLSVLDTGIGFDPGQAEQLFSKGFSTKNGGTGLGLANCRQIVESHGGTLLLQSPGPGQGAVARMQFLHSPN